MPCAYARAVSARVHRQERMLFSPHVFEVVARERQEHILAEAREDRRAAAAGRENAALRRSRFAPVLAGLGEAMIRAGENLRRAAYP